MAYVYAHKIKNTSKFFYIGISKNLKRSYIFGRNYYWDYIAKKYGYDVVILHKDISFDEAQKIEKQLIKRYGRLDKGREF